MGTWQRCSVSPRRRDRAAPRLQISPIRNPQSSLNGQHSQYAPVPRTVAIPPHRNVPSVPLAPSSPSLLSSSFLFPSVYIQSISPLPIPLSLLLRLPLRLRLPLLTNSLLPQHLTGSHEPISPHNTPHTSASAPQSDVPFHFPNPPLFEQTFQSPTTEENRNRQRERERGRGDTYKPAAYPPNPLTYSACTAVMRSRFSRSARWACSWASWACRWEWWRVLTEEGTVERRVVVVSDCGGGCGCGCGWWCWWWCWWPGGFIVAAVGGRAAIFGVVVVNVGVEFGMEDWDGTGWVLGVGCGGVEDGARALTSEKTRCVTCCAPYGRLYLRSLTLHGINLWANARYGGSACLHCS